MKTCYVCLLTIAAATAFAQDSQTTGWIVIPVSEYSALRGKAFPVEREPEEPPLPATLTRVDYGLRVDGELASGRATLTIDVLKDGWVRVPVPAGLAIREARTGGKLVSLVRAGNTDLILLSQTGRSVIELDVGLPVTASSGEERLILPASAAGITRATISLAQPDVELKVTGGLLAERVDGEGEAAWTGFAHGSEPLAFTWRRKMEEQKRPPRELRMRGSLAQLLSLSEDGTTVSAEVRVEVIQGAGRTIRVKVPAAITVNTVTGPNVADWESRGEELMIGFLEPVEQKSSFVISGESNLARDGKIDLPLIRLLDCENESGGVAVEVLGEGEIRNLRSQGLERTEAGELGAEIGARQSPSLVAFRYRAGLGDRSLSVDVVRYSQEAVLTANIEEARYRALLTADGKTLVEAQYAVRNNQRNFVRIVLPAGARLWSGSVNSIPVSPGQGPDGSLLLPLVKSHAGEDAPVFTVEFLYLSTGSIWPERGRTLLSLPAADLPISRTRLLLYYPPKYNIIAQTGALRVQPFEWPVAGPFGNHAISEQTPPPLNPSPAQALVEHYRARQDAHRVEAVPLRVGFPAVGPSIYLAGELTAENQAPTVALNYHKERRGGRQ